ncbi:endolytic transglycosylase MltG [Collinsella tanakaei]|uniref:endolytic transglycosylase MltG n=1 Tax=Collinsella tanakaei TaxID=626935 RepID=UPI00195EFBBA|nr:endolytic transglycosylase MltG [Collinsella tanakaei]MBM6756328.1 endolytic transglycosylase MltG [Collinsella tanakaei]
MAPNDGRAPRRSQTSTASTSTQRPAGKRFREPAGREGAQRSTAAPRGTRTATPRPAVQAPRPHARRTQQRTSPVPAIVGGVIIAIILIVVCFVVVPTVHDAIFGAQAETVAAGQEVQLNIPEGSSGDDIAQILAQNHIIDNPKAYYAAVEAADAAMSIKPGDYILTTGQDPASVVTQLVEGPNVEGITLTIQEGLTVAQTAARVEETLGIPADEFIAQAKASNYVADYPFLEGAYDDSLEGYLYPKTYSFSEQPTADQVIRTLLDQFQTETASLGLDNAPTGLSAHDIVTMASLIERETAVADERPLVASVMYNRLAIDMPLQIDAAIVYARGGGSDPVTYDDLEIDSPYNIYQNLGLTPGPICSPSVSSIEAALNPSDTDYLYYVASPDGDGTHRFSSDYEQFERDSQEYSESHQ